MIKIEGFKIIGIETETTNENGKGAIDIGNLWEKFFAENVPSKILNQIDDEIYSIYTDYESDFKGKYKTILGLKVDSLQNIPSGLVGREFNAGKYQKFMAKGTMPNAVGEKWQEIWANDSGLNRKYTADFEVYGKKALNGENSEVDIFIAIK